ncbi:GNAT family N-acetyltransferase (plasmid) [Streptomyces sp. AM 4-1-1]|uniref:GNAT family N-acetyltransferase n=1 Tax=Streptomyces sp. AM 4-1-1 TaxID=3028710 RepID=UPI0023BA01A7|nr:GNAT family N-acetyltransferase [Streptomyces sp. AM 4-1-1]WEH37894.1 GNAT family N-acetyltransferase [Streptomyces sp. AM 4-1-1]
MLAMRPATPDDQPRLAEMIQARSDWMKDKQLPNWHSWGKHVHELASNCTRRPSEMWVLTGHDDHILGCTTILRTAAPWTWTTTEAADSAYYLNGTVTDPAERHRKLGAVIAHWVVDRAAREGISRVRRDCTSPALAEYYQQQNFQLIRQVSAPGGHTSYALERKAARVPEIASWVSSSGVSTPEPARRSSRMPLTENARPIAVEAAQ